MARRLGAKHNEMIINDQISGSEISLHYRLPTNKERVRYQTSLVNVRGFRLKVNSFETRLEFGMAILIGFRDGDFEVGRDGKWQPISSQPDSPDYFPDWRAWVQENAPDLITALAGAVFEGATAQPSEEETSAEMAVEGGLPGGKNFHPSSIGILASEE